MTRVPQQLLFLAVLSLSMRRQVQSQEPASVALILTVTSVDGQSLSRYAFPVCIGSVSDRDASGRTFTNADESANFTGLRSGSTITVTAGKSPFRGAERTPTLRAGSNAVTLSVRAGSGTM